jgi:uncharacterized protein YigE (DUF2233 family)
MRWTAFFLMALLTSAAAAPCAPRQFEGSNFTICPFDAKTQAMLLALPFSRGFAGLSAQGVTFGMNAGMFDNLGAPIGLYVEDGKALHPLNSASGSGNFYMLPNGVFSQDANGRLHIETTQAFAARHAKPRWATQSGPILLIGGTLHPQISNDGPSRNIRNGVCLRDSGYAIFAISEDPVSFGRLARLFRDALGCRDALYLDGFVSSLWVPAARRMDARALLGPVVIVTNR